MNEGNITRAIKAIERELGTEKAYVFVTKDVALIAYKALLFASNLYKLAEKNPTIGKNDEWRDQQYDKDYENFVKENLK